MKCYVTSTGESTTDLCVWALERNGFDVELVYNETSTLAEKLDVIYHRANDTFLRVDADVIVNKNCNPDMEATNWWTQYMTYNWYKQDISYGGVQLINKKCLPILRDNIKKYMNAERPESQMFRLAEFNNPRRCSSLDLVVGLHGYKQNNIQRVIDTKKRRGQYDDYDFELAQRIEEL